jgi:hypothetical protein
MLAAPVVLFSCQRRSEYPGFGHGNDADVVFLPNLRGVSDPEVQLHALCRPVEAEKLLFGVLRFHDSIRNHSGPSALASLKTRLRKLKLRGYTTFHIDTVGRVYNLGVFI